MPLASLFRDKGVTACTAIGTFGNNSDAVIGLELSLVLRIAPGEQLLLRRP